MVGEDGGIYCDEPGCDRGEEFGKPFNNDNTLEMHLKKHGRGKYLGLGRTKGSGAGASARSNKDNDDPAEPVALPRQPTRGNAKKPALDKRIAAGVGSIGGGVYLAGQALRSVPLQRDGALVVDIAPELGQAWAEVASESEVMRRLGELLAGGGAWGSFALVVMKLGMGIASNHGWMPGAPAMPAASNGAGGMPNPADMLAAFGITPDEAAAMAQAFFAGAQTQSGRGETLTPDGADPRLTGAAVAGQPSEAA